MACSLQEELGIGIKPGPLPLGRVGLLKISDGVGWRQAWFHSSIKLVVTQSGSQEPVG